MKKSSIKYLWILALPVLALFIGMIGSWFFTSINEKQERKNEMFLREFERENRLELLPILSGFDRSDSEWISDEDNILSVLKDPFDPIVSLRRYVERFSGDNLYVYYGLGGIAVIAVILVIRSFVLRRRLFNNLDKLCRNINELNTKNDSHQRYTFTLEQIHQDIREINKNCVETRLEAKRINNICRELSDIRLKPTLGDLVEAEKTVNGMTDALETAITILQNAIQHFENKCEELTENNSIRLSNLHEILRNTVTAAREAAEKTMQVTCMYSKTE